MNASITRELPFEAWIWDDEAHRLQRVSKQRVSTLERAKAWLMERIAADPGAVEYSIEHHGDPVFVSDAVKERARKLIDRCMICGDRNPTLIRAEQGALCEDCCESLDAGEEQLDAAAALFEAIHGEDTTSSYA